jgi:hypothetical protein
MTTGNTIFGCPCCRSRKPVCACETVAGVLLDMCPACLKCPEHCRCARIALKHGTKPQAA